MKWIAKRSFYRVPSLSELVITGACKGAKVESPHPNEIQKGAIFDFGRAKDEAEFQTVKDPLKQLINELRVAGCIGDAADKEVVARVEREIAEEAKREASLLARVERTVNAETAARFMEVLRSVALRMQAK